MQAVIAVPSGAQEMLTQNVAGVPLLVRVMATAVRAGVKEVLLLWPSDADRQAWTQFADRPELRDLAVHRLFNTAPFDPKHKHSWEALGGELADEFLWLPWNFVTSVRLLSAIGTSEVCPLNWERPVLLKKERLGQLAGVPESWVEGVVIRSRKDVGAAERFLVANSGKATDGFYSKFNRMLSRPFVWALAHTPLTPNVVTLVGLAVAIYSAQLYSVGRYRASVGGAILFFISGLIDEMDGMLARIKFRESAFGTWFEGFVDNLTYLLLFIGITVGLRRQYGDGELVWGVALVAGCMMSVFIVAIQRQAMTSPDRPHEYAARINRMMERDTNLVSRFARHVNFFIKKGVAVHFVLLFTVCGCLQGFLRTAAISANITWTIATFLTWRFTRNHGTAAVRVGTTN